MNIIFDTQFQADLRKLLRENPSIKHELEDLIDSIYEFEEVPESYNPHRLRHPRGMYSGYWELHLQEGKFDVILIYNYRYNTPVIRFVRIGSHNNLFHNGHQ
ncbi:type II toxin-antitoxin system YafQ family toxin [Gardnerella pickettii]|uniref:Addiction module toxin, RelE/StbE family n=1 Tax=Gardnerella pickettii JCP7719 TaxID=1261061 RepID=S4IAI4_9BIFI|nr:type II toxin-antitoxin system mRNA interferase toxin, RelE/StbE family [Gardnerella pickettii]EPI51684.1 addiction module toxin, RelE/StbE family [Gardnerella pickettii JCP7719]EPI59882.1 addiction module toxin, RelE/StbE family [Gardnerella vaginalis JCP8066]